MNKTVLLTILAVSCLTFGSPGLAADKSMSESEGMDHSQHQMNQKNDQAIHQSMVEGHHLRYELIDMKAKMKNMKMDMPDMKSHHLMVYIMDKSGNPVTDAKVGYLVEGPGDSTQKAMAMGMNKGFGADVDLKPGTPYTIKTKIMAGDKKLIDEFSYKLK